MRQSCARFCVHNFQDTIIVCTVATFNFFCTNAIENILAITPIVNICMPYAIANVL